MLAHLPSYPGRATYLVITFRDSSVDGTVVVVHPSHRFEYCSPERGILSLSSIVVTGKLDVPGHVLHQHQAHPPQTCMRVQPLLPGYQLNGTLARSC